MNVQAAEPAHRQEPMQSSRTASPAHLRRLVLTGFMGAGKTTVGRLLAARIGWDFLDLDACIESRTGLTVPAIFAAHGEPHFRQLESQALASALGRSNLVLALGGGTPEVLTNRLLLEQTPATATIFLDAPFSTLYERCAKQARCTDQARESDALASPADIRPNLADPITAELRFSKRQPLYRRLAHHTIDTHSLTTEQAVVALLSAIETSSIVRP
jgi:shikimate kinase